MDAYKPLHHRQTPNLSQALLDAQTSKKLLMGLFSCLASLAPLKIAAVAGWDMILIDLEHSTAPSTDVTDLVQTVNLHSMGKTLSAVRVPNLHSASIAHALDAGAGGIMLPHTETAQEAKELVAACLQPPRGHRSAPSLSWLYPEHCAAPEGKDFFEYLNDNVAPIVQIESVLGVTNAEEILAVPGVKGCMIGVGDLSISTGRTATSIFSGKPFLKGGEDTAAYTAACHKIAALCQKYKVPLLIPGYPLDLEEVTKLGPGLIFPGVDGVIYAHALRGAVEGTRAAVTGFAEKAAGAAGKAHGNGQ